MVGYQQRFWWGLYVMCIVSCMPVLGFAGQSAAQESIQSSGGALSSPEVLAELEGFTSAGDSANFCFNATPDSIYNPGQSVKFNVFWSDTKEEDLQNTYLVRVDVQLPDGSSIIKLRNVARYDFAGHVPGTLADFCFAITTTIPTGAPSGTFPWRARVRKLEDFTKIEGELNDITIQPPALQ
jgi:hypothetical protein